MNVTAGLQLDPLACACRPTAAGCDHRSRMKVQTKTILVVLFIYLLIYVCVCLFRFRQNAYTKYLHYLA